MNGKTPNGIDPNSLKRLELSNASVVEFSGVLYAASNDKQTEANAVKEKSKHHAISDFEALLHTLKSSLGSGILAIPQGFKNAGMVVGVIGTLTMGFLCAHCTYLMVNTSQEMCRRLKVPFLGYTETVEQSMIHCVNGRFSFLSGIMRKLVECFMFVAYYGSNTAYILLVSETIMQVSEHHLQLGYSIRVYILITSVPIYFVGMVKSMKYLVPFSVIGNILLFVGLGFTFHFLWQDVPPLSSRPIYASISRIPLFISTALFGMEGIGTMLPIENSMRTPKHFLSCPGVLCIAMSIVVSLFISLGFSGFLKYGEATKGSITLNLPHDSFAEAVKLSIALAVFFSFGLQLTASVDVVWKRIDEGFKLKNKELIYYCVRSVMIVGAVILGLAVPNLGPVVSLLGAFGFSMCGFFFPALVNSLVLYDTGYGFLYWKLVKNIILAIIAIAALVIGSATSVAEIYNTY